jgi:hypothetical protein
VLLLCHLTLTLSPGRESHQAFDLCLHGLAGLQGLKFGDDLGWARHRLVTGEPSTAAFRSHEVASSASAFTKTLALIEGSQGSPYRYARPI